MLDEMTMPAAALYALIEAAQDKLEGNLPDDMRANLEAALEILRTADRIVLESAA